MQVHINNSNQLDFQYISKDILTKSQLHCFSLLYNMWCTSNVWTILKQHLILSSEQCFCQSVAIYHTHTRLTALCPGLPGWASTRKAKPIWILLKQETVSGSGISWDICKSAPRSRQITTPAPHRSGFFTGRMPFLPPNQQCQSTEGDIYRMYKGIKISKSTPHDRLCLHYLKFYTTGFPLYWTKKFPVFQPNFRIFCTLLVIVCNRTSNTI